MGKADLHMHSTASDGRFKPAVVVQKAADRGLSTISLTDHDTFAGFPEAARKGSDIGVRVIPGAEITTLFDDDETHLLAYNFDLEDDGIHGMMRKHRGARLKRASDIVDKLQGQGVDIDLKEVTAETGSLTTNVARPHIAEVLVNKGYVANTKEAFFRYLNDSILKGIEPQYHDIESVISIVKRAGGAIVLAHPGVHFSISQLDRLVEMGLDGLECIHRSHKYELQKFYTEYCDKHNLLKTGGSDFHGYGSDEENLGIVAISDNLVASMIRLTENRKRLAS